MTSMRLQRIDDLVRELSIQDDPDRLVRVVGKQSDLLFRRDGIVSVSRRELIAPQYRITRSWRWREVINPWTEVHRLPLFDHGLLGDLLYAGKPGVINRLEVAADDPAREHLEGMQALAYAPGYDHGQPLNMVMTLRREPESITPEDLESLPAPIHLLPAAFRSGAPWIERLRGKPSHLSVHPGGIVLAEPSL